MLGARGWVTPAGAAQESKTAEQWWKCLYKTLVPRACKGSFASLRMTDLREASFDG